MNFTDAEIQTLLTFFCYPHRKNMGLKVTFKEWIVLFILLGIFIAISGFLITFLFDVPGHIVTMLVLVIIFVIFKTKQWTTKEEGKEE